MRAPLGGGDAFAQIGFDQPAAHLHAIRLGLPLAGAVGLFQLALARGAELAEARSIAVNVFVMIETVSLFNCRSLSRPLWQMAPFSNPWVWFGAGTMLLLQLAFTYLDAFQQVFGTAPISLAAWGEIAAVALGVMATMEGEKAWQQRQHRSKA